MEKTNFIVLDPFDNIIETVIEQDDIKSTTDTLTLRVIQHLMFNGSDELIVRYVQGENRLQMHVFKHTANVDDGKIKFADYVTQRCRILVTSMFRTREKEQAKETIQLLIDSQMPVHPQRARDLYIRAGMEIPEHLIQEILTDEERKVRGEWANKLFGSSHPSGGSS